VILVVSGIRDVARGSERDVEMAVLEALGRDPSEMRFGGARGVDTIALAAAGSVWSETRLRVFVPGRFSQQPRDAALAISAYAGEVVELGMSLADKRSFLRRNDAMLDGATDLLAFTDGRSSGGTFYTIMQARHRGIAVKIVPVQSRSASARRGHASQASS
jgi:hypothetical protein